MQISAIVITRNEAKMLPGCLRSLTWIDELIVVDSASQDETVTIAKKYSASVISIPPDTDYASARNAGMAAASGDWILYVDADERVTPELRREIKSVINSKLSVSSYKIPRMNVILGKWLLHGGFWPDYVHRLFHKSDLIKWTGKLHESPTVKGNIGLLNRALKHYTARSIQGALAKSRHWAPIEAQLLLASRAPKVAWWKLIKAFIFKFCDVYLLKRGFLDGTRGLVLAYIQAFHQASVLINLWQLQNYSDPEGRRGQSKTASTT